MISTRVVLAFAALAWIYVAEEASTATNDCQEVTPNSFNGWNKTTRPRSPLFGLGLICEMRNISKNSEEKCIGSDVRKAPDCTFCCACMNSSGTILYNRTTLPKSFPCQPRRQNKP
uniref:Putative secreted protein n=1 Tax=Ixodes ricinus TaxID=34613 RepID=A0A147BFD9_IXORI